MILEVLNQQENCTVDEFSRETISITVRETVVVVLKH